MANSVTLPPEKRLLIFDDVYSQRLNNKRRSANNRKAELVAFQLDTGAFYRFTVYSFP